MVSLINDSDERYKMRVTTICLKELARQNNVNLYKIIIRKALGEINRSLQDNCKIHSSVTLLKAFYETTSIDVIYINRSAFLSIIKEETTKLLKPGKDLPCLNWELHQMLASNITDGLSTIVRTIKNCDDWSLFYALLNSNLNEKLDVCKALLDKLGSDPYYLSVIMAICLESDIELTDLISSVNLNKLDTKKRKELFYSALAEERLDFIDYGINKDLFRLEGELLVSSFSSVTFPEFLKKYCHIYKKYITKLLTIRSGCCSDERALYVLTEPMTLMILLEHEDFRCNSFIKDELFRFLFISCHNLLSSVGRLENRYTLLSAFCLLLDNSENSGGFSQDVINDVFSVLAFAESEFEITLVDLAIYIATTLISYGYVSTSLDFTEEFTEAWKENTRLRNLLDLLLLVSSQNQFNSLMRKIKGVHTVMTLKGMARHKIRQSIRIPFQKNLECLVVNLNLPYLLQRILNLDYELENLNARKIDFKIDKEEGVIFLHQDDAVLSDDSIILENLSFFKNIDLSIPPGNFVIVDSYSDEDDSPFHSLKKKKLKDVSRFHDAFT